MLKFPSPLDGYRSPFGPRNGGPSYSAEATAYFAAMSVQPSTALKDAVESLITNLKADGVWTLIDWLGLGPMHDEQAARVNLKNPSQVATIVGSPVFTAKQGYAGDNTAANLNSGVAGTTVTDTNSSLFARVRTNGSAIKSIAGYRSGRHELRHGSTSPASTRLVSGTGSASTTLSASGQFLCGSRTGTTTTLQVETEIKDTDTVATDTLGNTGTIRFLADGLTFSDAQLSYWGFGKHLDLTNATAHRLHCNTFVTTAEAL